VRGPLGQVLNLSALAADCGNPQHRHQLDRGPGSEQSRAPAGALLLAWQQRQRNRSGRWSRGSALSRPIQGRSNRGWRLVRFAPKIPGMVERSGRLAGLRRTRRSDTGHGSGLRMAGNRAMSSIGIRRYAAI